ncbi:MAG TPA: hypothetical protein VNK23_12440 [Candidatus Dormibacteraeota bacterium]|nr:hypothetical protein [Candidatus Dormibacteraeota bacterium]
MLQQAADAANLWQAGTPPYHLSAVVHLDLGGNKFDGRYDLWWAAPDKYREGLVMPAKGGVIAETDLALGDKFYVLRNTPTLSIPLWELRRALRAVPANLGAHSASIVEHPSATTTSYVSRVFSAQTGGHAETCMEIRNRLTVHRPAGLSAGDPIDVTQACFDFGDGGIVSISEHQNQEYFSPALEDLAREFDVQDSDFIQVGANRYPRQITTRNFDLTLKVTVTGLVQTTKFDSDTFQPPPHSVAWDWCANPRIDDGQNTVDDFYSSDRTDPLLVNMPDEYLAYYIRVGSGGQVNYFMPLRSAGSAVDQRVLNFLRARRYGIRSCGGHPIAWEGIVNQLPIFQP